MLVRKYSVNSVLFLKEKHPAIKVSPKYSENFDRFKSVRDGTVTILVSKLKVVWKQFGQIFAVIVIVFMDIVQEKDEPFPVIDSVYFAAAKHGIHNGSILCCTVIPTKHPVLPADIMESFP